MRVLLLALARPEEHTWEDAGGSRFADLREQAEPGWRYGRAAAPTPAPEEDQHQHGAGEDEGLRREPVLGAADEDTNRFDPDDPRHEPDSLGTAPAPAPEWKKAHRRRSGDGSVEDEQAQWDQRFVKSFEPDRSDRAEEVEAEGARKRLHAYQDDHALDAAEEAEAAKFEHEAGSRLQSGLASSEDSSAPIEDAPWSWTARRLQERGDDHGDAAAQERQFDQDHPLDPEARQRQQEATRYQRGLSPEERDHLSPEADRARKRDYAKRELTEAKAQAEQAQREWVERHKEEARARHSADVAERRLDRKLADMQPSKPAKAKRQPEAKRHSAEEPKPKPSKEQQREQERAQAQRTKQQHEQAQSTKRQHAQAQRTKQQHEQAQSTKRQHAEARAEQEQKRDHAAAQEEERVSAELRSRREEREKHAEKRLELLGKSRQERAKEGQEERQRHAAVLAAMDKEDADRKREAEMAADQRRIAAERTAAEAAPRAAEDEDEVGSHA